MITKFTKRFLPFLYKEDRTESLGSGLAIGHFKECPEGANGLRTYLSQTVFK